ncbi:MAG: PD40 domain-containing protein [Candidatus Eisenbacteria bacterium]|nr:PD40 domain-containing protein [Candidatus Eisenbacteria bacterium]
MWGVVSLVCGALLGAAAASVTGAEVAAPDGGGSAAPYFNDSYPQWSHGGRWMAFTSDRFGDPEIVALDAASRSVIRLTESPGRDAHPSFSHDDRRIAFQTPRGNGTDTNVWVMAADGTDARQLTTLAGFAGVPTFSPDDRKIAFQWRVAPAARWRICVMQADGSNMQVLTDGSANCQVPVWSPDGNRLLFFSDRGGPNRLFTMADDGGALRELQTMAPSGANDMVGAWSPDGRRIAFLSDRDRNGDGVSETDIYVMTTDGRALRCLTEGALGAELVKQSVAWAPDGSSVYFSGHSASPKPAEELWSGIYSVAATGGDPMRIDTSSGAAGGAWRGHDLKADARGRPANERSADREALLAAHAAVLRAHREDDLAAWLAIEADTLTLGNRGEIRRIAKQDGAAGREAYLEQTEFAVYQDRVPPAVTVSADGTLGWVVAQVEAQGVRRTDDGVTPLHDVWVWVELYQRRPEGWRMVGNVSNVRAVE